MANNLWSNYTEKTATPVDADEVMVRDSMDGKNKRLLFGTFWKWVAKKLNEATISELETDNKTIIGAINALNGKTVNKSIYSNMYARNISMQGNTSIIIDLKTANSIAMLFCSKNYIFFIHAYSKDGIGIDEFFTKNINGYEISPTNEGIIITIPLEVWLSGFMILSYTQTQPGFRYK